MFLNVGDIERIEDPTPDQISAHLRSLPPSAPFLILDADAEHFIQATPQSNVVRVEWRQERRQRYMLVSVERAEQALLAFRRWDEAALAAFPWKRLSVLNDAYRGVLIAAHALLLIALVKLCLALRS